MRHGIAVCLLVLLPAALPSVVAAEEPAPVDAARLFREGLTHEAAGRVAEAHRAFEAVIAVEPDHGAARRALGYEKVDGWWLRGDDLRRAKGFVRHDGRWLTAEEFADATRPERTSRSQREGEQRVLALLAGIASEDASRVAAAKRRMAATPARHRLAPLARALRCRPASLRRYAAEELARLDDARAVPALLRRTIVDPDAGVRRAAAGALREIDEPSTIAPLARALWSRDAGVRVRAAEALGELGDVAAAPYVITRWEKRSGDFPRSHLTTVRQVAFIQDFDVEVASTSFIADPIVGTLQEGVVLDVRVLATEQVFTTKEAVAYRGALARLAGQDLGDGPRAWRRWWDARARVR